MKIIKSILIFSLFIVSASAENIVELYPTVKKYIGEHSELDRTRYFYIHSTLWDAETQAFFSEYNVNRGGRGFWGPGAEAKRQTGEVAVYPAGKTAQSGEKAVTRYVATEHPYNVFKDNMSSEDYANWVVEYYQNWVSESGRPEYFEPMNEPMVHAKDFYDEPDYDDAAELRVRTRMSELFRDAARKIKATPDLKNMKIIGYASAYPAIERNDFTHWNKSWKLFMDIAGADVDAWCVHLYDGINVVGQDSRRSGSNVDAILDMIETYSYDQFDVVKPFAIDEYGGIEKGGYDSFFIQNAQSVRSQNSILFQLLDRQDRMEISIPFTGDKSKWHLTAEYDYQPYGAVLWVDKQWLETGEGRPANQVTEWVYTDRIYFFELWKNVKGYRVESHTSNPDVQVQAFVDENKLYVGLNNLDDNSQTVYLSQFGQLPGLTNVLTKSLVIPSETAAEYNESNSTTAPESVSLDYGETMMLEYTFEENVSFEGDVKCTRYYSDDYIKTIQQERARTFTFDNVSKVSAGYASVSMSLSRMPSQMNRLSSAMMYVNDVKVNVPSNWKGYDQMNRDDFFGTIEVPVPISALVEGRNKVSVEFLDNGGFISSVVLNVAERTGGPTALEDQEAIKSFSLVPNPAQNQVRLVGLKAGELVSVYSLAGRLLFSESYNGNALNISGVDSGVYLVKAKESLLKMMIE